MRFVREAAPQERSGFLPSFLPQETEWIWASSNHLAQLIVSPSTAEHPFPSTLKLMPALL